MASYKYGVFGKYEFYRIFGTPVKQLLLRFFAEKQNQRLNVLEIQKATDLPGSSVSVALAELEEEGVVDSAKEGKFKYYTLNKKVAEELSDIFQKLDSVYQIALKTKKKRENETQKDG